VECSRTELRKGIAELKWTVASNPGSAQRVEVTIYRDGFERRRLESSELLPPDQSFLAWERLDPGIIHYARVLTRHGEEWVPSASVSFQGPTCVADSQRK
jgi:hypothetical protein